MYPDPLERAFALAEEVYKNKNDEMGAMLAEINCGAYGVVIETPTWVVPVKDIEAGLADIKNTPRQNQYEHYDERPSYDQLRRCRRRIAFNDWRQ